LNLIRVMPAKGAGGQPVTTRAVDAAVIGGGLIGLTTAWRLAQRGLDVLVIDPTPAEAASHAAGGMLAPVSEVKYGEEALLEFALEALRRYPDFVTELEADSGMNVGLRREGTLIVATDAGDRAMLVDLHAFQTKLGLTSTMMTSSECRSLEPMVSPDARCGLLVTSDHSLDNRRLAAALFAVLATKTVEILRQRVDSIAIAAGTATGVTLDNGDEIVAGVTILAAGPWCGELAGIPAALRTPVRPVKGQIMRMRATARAPLPTYSIRGLVNGHEIYLIPRADGELVVGATVEEVGFDTTVRAGAVRELLRDARAVMPSVDELELVETIAALRPGSPDNSPIVGATGVDGLFVATGHHRNGVLLAPITADLIAAAVTQTESTQDRELLDLVSPQRFHGAEPLMMEALS
jgi:glycine oxidase